MAAEWVIWYVHTGHLGVTAVQVSYLDPNEQYPPIKEKLGHWVGIAENVADQLTYLILTTNKSQICCLFYVYCH